MTPAAPAHWLDRYLWLLIMAVLLGDLAWMWWLL
jgi:hypothetical protein